VTTPSIPTSATAIATVGSQTISAIPGSLGVVLPNGSIAKPGSVATVTDSNSQPVVVSVGTSGIYVGGTGSSDSTGYYANPTIPPVAIATVASQIISAAPGATNVVVGSQTASLGGAPITVSGSVIQLTPSGVVINDASGGAASTYAIPTLADATDVVSPTPIATIGGQVISAAAGDSTVVINGQVVTAGGALVTLAGSNNVASLGPSGLVIQYPGGSVSSFALPTAAPSAIAIVGTVAGMLISAPAGAPVISIGSQAATLGGSPVTISNDVMSLGPSGLEIQMPGGGVTTISAQAEASTATGEMTSTTSGKGIASIIASSMSSSSVGEESGANSRTTVAGVSQTSTGSVSASSGSSSSTSTSAGASSPAAVNTSAAARIPLGSSLAAWTALFTMLGLMLV
jgi:hypothetical protein